MTEEVLHVNITANGKLVCISLLDSTVKVFFEDSLKFFLSLYGHKLPVLAMDAADDSTLLATASADKSVKLWGLDFGDCHKSLHAHDDSVTGVKFVPGTHYFFTTGKDKMLKYWDGDKREMILSIPGHHAEVWGLVISHTGDVVITGSNDRSIRLWQRTEDQVFIQEEQENMLESLFDDSLDKEDEQKITIAGEEAQVVESGMAAKANLATVKAGERLFEAVELAEQEAKELQTYAEDKARAEKLAAETGVALPLPNKPEPNILLLGRSGSENLLHAIRKINSAELQQALLLLPLSSVMTTVKHIKEWLENNMDIELSCRCLFFLLRVHYHQIAAGHHSLVVQLQALASNARQRLRQQKELVGVNLAAMNFLRYQIEEESSAAFFGTQLQNRMAKRIKIKR